jgi:hypothetical protein
MYEPDGRFDMSLYSFKSASALGVETIFEIRASVGASGKAKRASEGYVVNQSIIDPPQKQKQAQRIS